MKRWAHFIDTDPAWPSKTNKHCKLAWEQESVFCGVLLAFANHDCAKTQQEIKNLAKKAFPSEFCDTKDMSGWFDGFQNRFGHYLVKEKSKPENRRGLLLC